MKRYIVLILLGLLCAGKGLAQRGDEFFKPYSWEQASMLAAKEDKLVLVEVGDVGQETRLRVSEQGDLVEHLSRNVVAIRIDMNTPQGKAFESRLMLYAYPAYVFFMPYGDLVGIAAPGEVRNHPERLREVLDEAEEAARIKKRNSRRVKFMDLGVEDALALADKEDKNVFVYVSDASNQPSLLMDRNVFTLDRVADYFNRHFINLRLNARYASRLGYEVKEVPAFFFLNDEGKVLFRAEGYCTSEQLLGYGEKALEKAKGIPFQAFDEQARAQAGSEGKFIFTDYYVPGRVHQELVRDVFTDPDVTDYFVAHFVNTSKEVSRARMTFSDGNGRMLHSVLRVENATELLNEARKVLTGRGLAGLSARYRQGNRSAGFMEEYILTLARAGEVREASRVTMEYLTPLSPDCLRQEKYWDLFNKYALVAETSFFDYTLLHRAELGKMYGDETVHNKISALWIAGAVNFIRDGQFDEEGFKLYVKRLKKEKFEGWQLIARNARMAAAEQMADWKIFINLAEEKWNEEEITDAELYRWAQKINERCRDGNVRYKMAQWLSQRVDDINRKEHLTGKVDLTSYRGFFEKLTEDLLR